MTRRTWDRSEVDQLVLMMGTERCAGVGFATSGNTVWNGLPFASTAGGVRMLSMMTGIAAAFTRRVAVRVTPPGVVVVTVMVFRKLGLPLKRFGNG